MPALAKKEKEMMRLLWDTEYPLNRQQIIQWGEKNPVSWKPISVSILLNSLIDKKMVSVVGFSFIKGKLGRLYEARVSEEEYARMQAEEAAKQAKNQP